MFVRKYGLRKFITTMRIFPQPKSVVLLQQLQWLASHQSDYANFSQPNVTSSLQNTSPLSQRKHGFCDWDSWYLTEHWRTFFWTLLWLHEITRFEGKKKKKRLNIAFSQQEWERGRRGPTDGDFQQLRFILCAKHRAYWIFLSCVPVLMHLNETIDNLCESSCRDINGAHETMRGAI